MDAEPVSFGAEFFGAVDLGHRRRNRRRVDSANTRIAHPTGTLPQKLRGPAELQTCDRLMNHPAVTHAAILAPAVARPRERMAGVAGTVLVVHDWTESDDTGHTTMAGVLGPIGNGTRLGVCRNSNLAPTASRLRGRMPHKTRPSCSNPPHEHDARTRKSHAARGVAPGRVSVTG